MAGSWKNKDRAPDFKRYIAGEGPEQAEIMFVGDHPGIEESWSGRPFTGRSGRLMDVFLLQESLIREDLYLTNAVKYYTESSPSPHDVRRDRPGLFEEIRRVRPRYVGLLGALAVRSFLGPDVHLEWAHGLAFPGDHGVTGYMPMYNPAFGLRDVDSMPLVRDDFHQFKLMVQGKIAPHVREDEYPRPTYIELTDDPDCLQTINVLLHQFLPGKPISIDTEGWWYNPWGLSFCLLPGRAYVIHKSSTGAMWTFGKHLLKSKRLVRLHNSLHDIEVLRALGISGFPFVDTMIQSYHLCLEPQGLKPLARRHCGMDQDDYSDITREAGERLAIEYLEKVLTWGNKQLCSESNAPRRAKK